MLVAAAALLLQIVPVPHAGALGTPLLESSMAGNEPKMVGLSSPKPVNFVPRHESVRLLAMALPDTHPTLRKTSSSAPLGDATRALEAIRIDPPPIPAAAFRAGPPQVVERKRLWATLLVAQHTAATFDAWTTRRAVEQGHRELNPLLRPFSHSPAVYGAVQIGPGLLDYLGLRMRRSGKTWVRRLWWLPQTAGTAVFIYSSVHNLGQLQ